MKNEEKKPRQKEELSKSLEVSLKEESELAVCDWRSRSCGTLLKNRQGRIVGLWARQKVE